VPRITARRRGSGWGSATGPECRRPRSAKRIDSPSMMHGSSARSGRLCLAVTARGRSDSMVSRVVIESRRRPVPDPGGGPQPRLLRPCRRPGRSRRDVGGLGRCRWWCTRDLDPPAPGNARPQARPATDTEQAPWKAKASRSSSAASPHCSPTAPRSRQLDTEHSHAQKWMFCKRSVSSARGVLQRPIRRSEIVQAKDNVPACHATRPRGKLTERAMPTSIAVHGELPTWK
jgi:hypothetical protein